MALLKIASYNIHNAVGVDGRFDPERIHRVLADINADVVALQEIEKFHDGFDTLTFLASATGMAAVAGPAWLRTTGEYGNALLTRGEIQTVERIDLSVSRREPRNALDVEVRCGDVVLRVLATHLGLRPGERRHQVRRLLECLRPGDKRPTLLAGDINEWFLWGRPLRWLHAYFKYAPAPPTFPAWFPVFALDRIWMRPRQQLREVAVHSTPLTRVASDHLPLIAVVDVPPAETSDSNGSRHGEVEKRSGSAI